MKDSVRRLELYGYTEEEIHNILLHGDKYPHLSYLKVRRAMVEPTKVLSPGAKVEVYYADDGSRTISAEAQRYRTTEENIANARASRRKTAPKTHPTYDELKRQLPVSGTLANLAKDLGCSLAYAQRMLGSTTNTAKVLALLDQGLTHAQIAEEIGCGREAVTALNVRHRTARPYNKDHDWPTILQYLDTHTVSETARHFSVSRANIYYHRNKT